jgi:hypothetical protein
MLMPPQPLTKAVYRCGILQSTLLALSVNWNGLRFFKSRVEPIYDKANKFSLTAGQAESMIRPDYLDTKSSTFLPGGIHFIA